MSIYSGPVFEMAREQFVGVADHLKIPEDDRSRLLYPKRAITVSVPIHRDDGKTEVFQGLPGPASPHPWADQGGTRFSPTLEIGEVAALAIWMSWKCALAGLPYGGAKGGVCCDPYALSIREREALSRRYMQEMVPFVGPHTDIMAPDVGTNEQVMAWFLDTYSVHQGHTASEIVTGKPVSLGGSVGRREATGRGVCQLIALAMKHVGHDHSGQTAIVQGFGNVGSVTATILDAEMGIKVIGISDHMGAYYCTQGLPIPEVVTFATLNGSLRGWSKELLIDPNEMLTKQCDILVPAAVERVIDARIARELSCRILAEGANGPTTPDADRILDQRNDIFVVPDTLCNSGGVILSYFEWVQGLQRLVWSESQVNDQLAQLLENAFNNVVRRAMKDGVSNRLAATAIGVERVAAGKRLRGLFP